MLRRDNGLFLNREFQANQRENVTGRAKVSSSTVSAKTRAGAPRETVFNILISNKTKSEHTIWRVDYGKATMLLPQRQYYLL